MIGNFKKRITWFIISSQVIFFYSCSPARQEIESYFKYIENVRTELRNDKSTEENKQKLLSKARKRILKIIDTEYVARLSLGKYYDLITDKQRLDYSDTFRQILAYNIVQTHVPIHKIADQNISVELLQEEAKHDSVFNIDAITIHTKFISSSITYFIDFYLHASGKTYKLYDVYVDGASVLLDYRNQFYSIIESKGFPFLLERLKEKLKDTDSG